MVILRRVGIYSFLLLVLFSSALAVECPGDYYINSCADQDTRAAVVDTAMAQHYSSMSSAFTAQGTHVSEAYPAALFFLGRSSTKQYANQFLPIKLAAQAPIRSPRDAVYLAWISSKYGSTELELKITNTIKTQLTSYLIGNAPSETEQKFLFNVAKYVKNKDAPTLTTLKNTLKINGGVAGWGAELEQNPARMDDVVIGLLALYDESPDPALRKLAEMHLDLIFTRFAAASVDGTWVSPVAGATIANNAYVPEATPWHGWAVLLFNAENTGVTEPSLLVSGYCAHPITRRIAEFTRSVQEKTASGKPLLTVVEKSNNIFLSLSASQDIDGSSIFMSEDGYVNKAQLRTGTGAFIELNARTGTEGDDSEKNLGAQTALFHSSESVVLLGRLEGSSCQEPHALVSGFTVQPIADNKGFLIYSDGVYVLLRYLGPSQDASLAERYAPRSNLLPNDDYEVLYPLRSRLVADGISDNMVGSFALEVIPSSFVDFLRNADNPYEQCTDDLATCLIGSLATNTSFTREVVTGKLVYKTKLKNPLSTWKTYTYLPGGEAKQGTTLLSTNGYGLRRVVKSSTVDYLNYADPVWTLKGSTGLSTTATVHLNFGAATPALMKTNADDQTAYVCEQNPETGGEGDQDIPGLGFIAANFLKKFSTANYVIDCGPGTSVLPNAAVNPDNLVLSSCVIEANGKRTVALAYNPNAQNVLESIFNNLGGYFPYDPIGGPQSITPLTDNKKKMCNAKAEQTADSFDIVQCDSFSVSSGEKGLVSYDNLYTWVNGKENVIFISQDANPFTTGFADELRDWFRDLFGDPLVQGETEGVESFDAAYFYHQSSRDIKATLLDGNAEILVTNFVKSVQPLASLNSVEYGAQGTTQYLAFDANPEDEMWASFTRKLRVADIEGEPFSGESECGNKKIEYGEQCDPNTNKLEQCADDPDHYVKCVNCQSDESACCVDLDGDGYFGGTCAGIEQDEVDCVDEDPEGYYVQGSSGSEECKGVIPGDSDDPCLILPTSACPQCINPGRQQDICCDGVDNDCAGGDTDPAVCEPNCDTVVPPGGEPNACEATNPGGEGNPCTGVSCVECPSSWVTKLTLGHYTFSTRNDEQGHPQLKIVTSGGKEGNANCDLFEAPSGSLTFLWPAPTSEIKIFNNDGEDWAKVFLKAISTDRTWQIRYEDGGSEAKNCWNHNGGNNVIGTVVAPAEVMCQPAGGGAPPTQPCPNVCIIDDYCALDCEDDSACVAACATTAGCTADPDCIAGTCKSNKDCPLAKPQCNDPDGDGSGTCEILGGSGGCHITCNNDQICTAGQCSQIA